MASHRLVTVYGTVMSTRAEGRRTLHHVEATGPGGDHLDLLVYAKKRHRGSVTVRIDPTGDVDPRFSDGIPWGTVGLVAGIAATIVTVGWFLFG